MERLVEPEWLDTLPARDNGAVRSRSDLRRINWLMGNVGVLERLLRSAGRPRRVVELGAGDGTFLLRLAYRLAPRWGRTRAVLVDRHDLLGDATRRGFLQLGWEVEAIQADAFEWLAAEQGADTILVANLFLHHFSNEQLRGLLQTASRSCRLFGACEPRRSGFALTASRWLGLIGCNAVTRHDAPASVRAGFAANELSSLWPRGAGWELREDPAGLFSHCFLAQKSAEL
jgi:SAM-dependent methyltransferase